MCEFWVGVVVGVLCMLLLIANFDTLPVEAPLIAHCNLYDAGLKDYDLGIFNCSNGATFDRDTVKKQER